MPKFLVPKHIPRHLWDRNKCGLWLGEPELWVWDAYKGLLNTLQVCSYTLYKAQHPFRFHVKHCWCFSGLCSCCLHSWRQILQVKAQHSLSPFFWRADPSCCIFCAGFIVSESFAHERTTKLRSLWPRVWNPWQLSSVSAGASSIECPWEPALLGSVHRWLQSTSHLRSLSPPVHPWSGNNATGRDGGTHTDYLCISFLVEIWGWTERFLLDDRCRCPGSSDGEFLSPSGYACSIRRQSD